jgi:hypothetical protein
MGNVSIGLNQTSKPAPLGYRKFLNAYIVVVVPAFTTMILVLPIDPTIVKYIFAGLTFTVAVAKGLGMILGNGQTYAPSNETVEDQSAAKPTTTP